MKKHFIGVFGFLLVVVGIFSYTVVFETGDVVAPVCTPNVWECWCDSDPGNPTHCYEHQCAVGGTHWKGAWHCSSAGCDQFGWRCIARASVECELLNGESEPDSDNGLQRRIIGTVECVDPEA